VVASGLGRWQRKKNADGSDTLKNYHDHQRLRIDIQHVVQENGSDPFFEFGKMEVCPKGAGTRSKSGPLRSARWLVIYH
jgi:hypothetical protein